MKWIASILLLFFCCVQSFARKTSYDGLTTVSVESSRFADSLSQNGVDTIIRYYRGSAACPVSTSPIAVIYWTQHNASSIVIFREVNKFRRHKRYVTYEECHLDASPLNPIIAYVDDNASRISKDSLSDYYEGKTGLYIINYTFEAIKVKAGKAKLDYVIDSRCREQNLSSPKITFIDIFRSVAFDYFLQALKAS